MKENRRNWLKSVLEHIPHGEDGSLTGLKWNDAMTLQKLLLKNGYAVCITSGDFNEEYMVAWIYAGDTDNLDYADYEHVAFFSTDYLEDYPEAYEETYGIVDENEDEPVDNTQITFDDCDECIVKPEDYSE